MTAPLVALGALAAVGGFLNTPFRLGPLGAGLEHFLEPAFEAVEQAHLPAAGTQWLLALVSVAAAAAGIWYGWRRYAERELPAEDGGIWDTLLAGYRVDDLYGHALVLPGKKLSEAAAFTADMKIVDGAVNGVGALVTRVAARLRPIQSGLARSYGVGILAGAVALVVWLLVSGGGS